ncbi:hypothetical protein LUZ60_016156 [Juncus effusus]|nr:hypothetical protein LUZ60_016156 [Juncus effusus]
MSIQTSFLLLLLTFFFNGEKIRVYADTLVTGMVFCDQCKDGQRSFFDYPLSGAKVEIRCATGESKLQTTNWFGCYTMRLEGSLDLSGCTARVVDGPSQCGFGFGPAKELNLIFRLFGAALYMVDLLLSQPGRPMSFCPNNGNNSPDIPFLPPLPSPKVWSPPLRVLYPPPRVLSPPTRVLAPPVLPPALQGSACTYDKWMMPEYECHWKIVTPNTTVAIAFGPIAAAQYGPNMTLSNSLQGKGNVYSTLLREATASLLNSYHSHGFFYTSLGVIGDMNSALVGPTSQALNTAMKFRKANSGLDSGSDYKKLPCNFTPCN